MTTLGEVLDLLDANRESEEMVEIMDHNGQVQCRAMVCSVVWNGIEDTPFCKPVNLWTGMQDNVLPASDKTSSTGIILLFRKKVLGHKIPKNPDPLELPEAKKEKDSLVGREGVTQTPLRPSGIVLIGGERKSVVTEGEFLDAGKTVRIIHVNGSRIVVEPVSK